MRKHEINDYLSNLMKSASNAKTRNVELVNALEETLKYLYIKDSEYSKLYKRTGRKNKELKDELETINFFITYLGKRLDEEKRKPLNINRLSYPIGLTIEEETTNYVIKSVNDNIVIIPKVIKEEQKDAIFSLTIIGNDVIDFSLNNIQIIKRVKTEEDAKLVAEHLSNENTKITYYKEDKPKVKTLRNN